MKAIYCVGTHWDREWYEPFQEFRMWLVELIDELMELMERDPEYKCFHLDGQTVVLQDYLEIRPERKEQLVAMLKARKFLVGPWYDLPDEWLISGESYVRNIMMGLRVCRSLGVPPMDFAYTPDQFGHIAALPMIMTGFGLKAGICWRGTQDENYPAQFIWIGPDGSRMVTHKLRDAGSYGPFDFAVRGILKAEGYPMEKLAEFFDPYFKNEIERSPASLVLMLDAIDHQRPDPEMPRLLKELSTRYPDIEFSWDSLEGYGAEMLKSADGLPERSGELREPSLDANRRGQYLIVHTISSRYPVKQRNDQCQAMLEKWAEPTALLQLLADGAPILSYLNKSWEYLLRNHPHDSICGCSIDQVHKDMHYRFDQSELIADGVARRALTHIAAASDSAAARKNIVVHNPLPFTRTGVFEISAPFPTDWPTQFVDGLTTGERVNKFILRNSEGVRVPFQFLGIDRGVFTKILNSNGRKSSIKQDVYHLAVEMTIPSCGYAGFTIESTDEGARNFGTRMRGPLSASTGSLTFWLNADGTGCIMHKPSGAVYEDLFMYEDCGDSGDGWTRGKLINDIVYRTPGSRVSTAIEEDGQLRTVFRVEREFDLPRMMERGTYHRSNDRMTLRVTDRIYVEKGAPYIRVRTRVENTCMDHRFRVLFPTEIDAKTSFAETPFAIVERPIHPPEESARWHERVNPEKAFTTFFGVRSESRGLAVLAPFGLHEYEVTQTPERSLALTLFRSTFKTVDTSGEPDGELLHDMEFEYMLYPFGAEFDPCTASKLVAEAQTGIRISNAETLPAPQSLLSLKGESDVVVTALKPAAEGDAGIIRFWNPTPQTAFVEVSIARPIASAALCNLNEDPQESITLTSEGLIPVSVPAFGLATIRFEWNK